MTPGTHAGQDASVAVLQQQQHQLEQGMRDLAKSVTEGFALMTAKVDRINELTTSIVAISERQAAHSDGLQRAFASIDTTNLRIQQMLEEQNSWRDQYASTVDTRFDAAKALLDAHKASNATDHADVKAEIANWRGMVKGAAAVLGMLIAVLGWLGGRYISSTERNADDIHKLQQEQGELEQQVNSLPYPVNRKSEVTP